MASEAQENRYQEYTIIFNLQSPDKMDQIVLKCLFSYEEAIKMREYLDRKILDMCDSQFPVSISIHTRNEEMKQTTYGLQNVIGIIHDIPNYQYINN